MGPLCSAIPGDNDKHKDYFWMRKSGNHSEIVSPRWAILPVQLHHCHCYDAMMMVWTAKWMNGKRWRWWRCARWRLEKEKTEREREREWYVIVAMAHKMACLFILLLFNLIFIADTFSFDYFFSFFTSFFSLPRSLAPVRFAFYCHLCNMVRLGVDFFFPFSSVICANKICLSPEPSFQSFVDIRKTYLVRLAYCTDMCVCGWTAEEWGKKTKWMTKMMKYMCVGAERMEWH